MLNGYFREKGKFYSEKIRMTNYLNKKGFQFTEILQDLNTGRNVWVFDYTPLLKEAVNQYWEHTREYINNVSSH